MDEKNFANILKKLPVVYGTSTNMQQILNLLFQKKKGK